MKAYDEVVEFIAGGPSASKLANYRASAKTKERVAELIHKEKTKGLTTEERAELDDYMQIEHLMRLVKARARHRNGA